MNRGARAVIRALSLAALGLASACQVLAGYDSFEPVPPHSCDPVPASKRDEKGVTTLVLVKETSGQCYFADETEVTVKQYQQFLDAFDASSAWKDKVCSWKAPGYPSDPRSEWIHAGTGDRACVDSANESDTPFSDNKPIRCVDWCDAAAFCSWAGMHLCAGNTNTIGLMGFTTDQWSHACSANGQQLPYGNNGIPKSGECNVGFAESGQCFQKTFQHKCGPTDVGNFPGCKGPSGTVDMIGNVAEWVLTCNTAPMASRMDGGTEMELDGSVWDGLDQRHAKCQHRGGSFDDSLDTTKCYSMGAGTLDTRDTRDRHVGFRCCRELTPDERNLKLK